MIMATNVEAEATTTSVTDAKPYVTVVNSSIQGNAKLLEVWFEKKNLFE